MDESLRSPQSLVEFEERLTEFLYYLRARFFGYTYEIVSTKTLKREKSNAILVDAMCDFERYCKAKRDEFFESERLQIYAFLKLALEREAPFDCEYHLGIRRDRSGLSLPQKNKIAVQVAAQVLWSLEKNKLPTIESMKDLLLDKRRCFYDLLGLNRFSLSGGSEIMNSRTIKNWIAEVFPVPKSQRKGHPKTKGISEDHFDNFILVPGVYLDNYSTVNFPKLRFVIVCITRVLKALGWSVDKITNSIFVSLYRNPLKFYPYSYVIDWIDEATSENGSIFGS